MKNIGIIMGSLSDWETMQHACKVLDQLNLSYEKDIISAHRTPDLMVTYAKEAEQKGLKVIIAGAGGAAHLPGMVSSYTTVPVIGVPVESRSLKGMDSLLSIVQMPGGVPTATMAIGQAGAINAGLFAAEIIASFDEEIRIRLKNYRRDMQQQVEEMRDNLAEK